MPAFKVQVNVSQRYICIWLYAKCLLYLIILFSPKVPSYHICICPSVCVCEAQSFENHRDTQTTSRLTLCVFFSLCGCLLEATWVFEHWSMFSFKKKIEIKELLLVSSWFSSIPEDICVEIQPPSPFNAILSFVTLILLRLQATRLIGDLNSVKWKEIVLQGQIGWGHASHMHG